MENLCGIIEQSLNKELHRIIISNKRRADAGKKVVVRPYEEKEKLLFQFSEYRNNQVFHLNMEKEDAITHMRGLMRDCFKQIEIVTQNTEYIALVSKKGKATIKSRPNQENKKIDLNHNRKKQYILPVNEKIPFLIELGIQTQEGKIIDKKYKKFRQINRFLEFIQDVMPELPKDHTLTIIDFGCGKSYLTFAMYYYLKVMNGYSVRMIGLDLKSDVIRHCNELAEKFGYDELTFVEGDISSFEGVNQVDLVVTLHACDTATDYALDKAVRWDAKVILSVPCCQHEMNRQIKSDILQPILKYGIIKERVAALFTDALRADLLEQQGYSVQILEFIDMEHTPKNLLIRAIKKDSSKHLDDSYKTLCDEMNLHGTLEQLLQ